MQKYMLDYYKRNPEYFKEKSKSWHSKQDNKDRKRAAKYGLTLEEFRSMPKCCEVCGSEDLLCIDHDEKTKEVRGILCSQCNTALGLLKEDPGRIRLLALYIEKHMPV